MHSLELQLQVDHENATPVGFLFGATGPGITPEPLLGPGGLASGLEDNSDMERVDGSGPAPLSASILIFHTYPRLGARSGGTQTAATGPAPASGPD